MGKKRKTSKKSKPETAGWFFPALIWVTIFYGGYYWFTGGFEMKDYREDLSNYTGKVGYKFPERKELGVGGYNNDETIYLNFPKGMKNEVLFKGKYKDGLKNGKWEVFPMEKPAFKGASAMKTTFGWAMTLTFLDGKPIGILEKYDMEGNLVTSTDCETGDCSYYFSKKHLDDMVQEMEMNIGW